MSGNDTKTESSWVDRGSVEWQDEVKGSAAAICVKANAKWDLGDRALKLVPWNPNATPRGTDRVPVRIAEFRVDIIQEVGPSLADEVPSVDSLMRYRKAARLVPDKHLRIGLGVDAALWLTKVRRSDIPSLIVELRDSGNLSDQKVKQALSRQGEFSRYRLDYKPADESTEVTPSQGNRPRQSLEEFEQLQEQQAVKQRERGVQGASLALINAGREMSTALVKLSLMWDDESDVWLSEQEHDNFTRNLDRIEKYVGKIRGSIEGCEVLPNIEPGDKPGDTIPVEWLGAKEGEK